VPRDDRQIIVQTFAGECDSTTPVEIADAQGSRVQDLYRLGGKLVRRKGSALLADLTPFNMSLDMLQWCKIGDNEFLIGSLNGNMVDYFGTLGDGTQLDGHPGRITAGAEANAAWIDGALWISDGIKQLFQLPRSQSVARATSPARTTGM
jgi:hypothetical protein